VSIRASLRRALVRQARTLEPIGHQRRVVTAGVAVLIAWGSAAPVAAHRPDQMGRQVAANLGNVESGSIGYDISFPNCNGSFPDRGDFRIVGVNGGRAFDPNPCLGAGDGPSELQWAGRYAWFYANTGNPGPRLSKRWPVGQRYPRRCMADDPLSKGCAYDYGWNAAKDSYRTAVRAYISLGWAPAGSTRTPVHNRWWLDVETSNSWRPNRHLNVANLQGAVAFLESRDVASIGFYSIPRMWEAIVGSSDAFAQHPSWMAGASTLRGAERHCGTIGFNGGRVALSQFPKKGFDANVAC